MKIKLKDLQPETTYSVQLRAKEGDLKSEWSRKFTLTTVTDERIPKTPTNVTWTPRRHSFVAEWDDVKENTNGTTAKKIIRYELELVAGSQRRIVAVVPKSDDTDGRRHFGLSAEENQDLFGGTIQNSITLRVRAVNGVENKSAWSTAITATFPTPNAPTNVTWVKSEGDYHGDWKEVTTNTNGTGATIIRYEVELTAGSTRKVIGITKQTDDDPSVDKSNYNLTRPENKALFGEYKKTVTFRVRAINAAEQKSAWSGIVTTDLGTPKAPTAVTWVPVKDAFHGEWDAVTTDTDNTPASISHYEVELTAGALKAGDAVVPQSKVRHSYDLSAARNAALFGSFQSNVSFAVRAVSKADNASAWSTSISAGHNAPPAPTNAVVTTTPQGIKVSWTPPADTSNVATYKVRVSTVQANVGTGTVIQNSSATEVTYTVNKSNITTYYFRITSVSPAGIESTGLDASGVPEQLVDDTPPSVPTGVSGSIVNSADGKSAKLTINWSFGTPPDDMSGFRVQYRRVTDTAWQMVTAEKDMRSVTVEAFPYVNYDLRVQSIDNFGNLSAWATGTATSPTNAAPGQVTGLTSKASVDSITYSWTESSDTDVAGGFGSYELQISTSNTFPVGSSTVTYKSGLNSFTAAGLAFNTTYYARVRAIDSLGLAGTWSTTNTTTTGTPPTTPLSDGAAPGSSPTPVVVGGIGYLHISWTAVSNNDIVTYEVHVSTTSGFTPAAGTKVAEVTGTAVVIEKDGAGTNLVYGTTYYVKIIAKDKDGAAVAGTQASGTPVKAETTDITSISFGQVTTGTLSTGTLTIQTGGIIKTAGSEVTITGSGITVTGATSSIQSDNLTSGAITASVSLTVNGTLSVANSGWIQSTGYTTGGTSGYRLSATGLDVKSGTITAGAITTGSIGAAGAAGLTLTNGSYIQLTSGYIKGGGYTGTAYSATASPGFYFGNDGLRIASGSVSISGGAISGDTITGTNFNVNSGGSVVGTGFTLSSAGLTVTGGTIGGVTIASNAIKSSNYPSSGYTINSDGSVVFNSGTFKGHMEASSGSFTGAVTATSGTFTGTVNANAGNFTGNITSTATISGGTISGATIRTADVGDRVTLSQDDGAGKLKFWADSTQTAGSINAQLSPLQMVINGPGAGKIYLSSGEVEVYNALLRVTSGQLIVTGDITASGTDNNVEGYQIFARSPATATNSTANVRWDSSGGQYKLTGASARRYKENIRDAEIDLGAFLQVHPRAYDYRKEYVEGAGPQVGLIADELEELGLTPWVDYDERTGRIENVDYARLTVPLLALCQSQQKQINDLLQRVEALEA